MDEMLLWYVTYQIHTYDQRFIVEGRKVEATNIGQALNEVDCALSVAMDRYNWSDYTITAVTVIPELR